MLRKVPVRITAGWHGHGGLGVAHRPSSVYCADMSESHAVLHRATKLSGYMEPDGLQASIPLRAAGRRRASQRSGDKRMEILMSILSHQEAGGGLTLGATLAGRLSVKMADIRQAAKEMTVRGRVNRMLVVATALLIATLAEHFGAEIDVWRPTLEKSFTWLSQVMTKNRPKVGRRSVVVWADEYVKKHVRIKS